MKRVSQPLNYYFWTATLTAASLALTLSGDLGNSIRAIKSVIGSALTTQHQVQPDDFTQAVKETAQRLGTQPEYLLAVMLFETGGSLNPCQRGAIALDGTRATGLIQFMDNTAKELGTSSEELCRMSQVEQMQWVERYLVQRGFKGGGLPHLYSTVFAGNPGVWDTNPNIGDGYHTLSSAVRRIEREHLPLARTKLKK
ncbi:hypothetical protein QPK87_25335 [Kamptonema cortianum]|nr:hypothetical protein [Kamptonema cortianum]